MKELLKRGIFGLVFLAIVFVPYGYDLTTGKHTFNVVLFLFSLIGTRELFAMAKTAGHPSVLAKWCVLFITVVVFSPLLLVTFRDFFPEQIPFSVTAWYTPSVLTGLFGVTLALMAIFIALIYQKKEIPFVYRGSFLLGMAYPLVPLLLLAGAMSSSDTSTRAWLLMVLLPIYLNDTLAYATGRIWGKTKLFPAVSPKKTWEGFIGGIVGTVVVMEIYLFFSGNFSIYHAFHTAFISLAASVLATYGDLFESKLKRAAGVKDSGNILPGHGGILDRIDAMLFVAPVLYVLLMLIS